MTESPRAFWVVTAILVVAGSAERLLAGSGSWALVSGLVGLAAGSAMRWRAWRTA